MDSKINLSPAQHVSDEKRIMLLRSLWKKVRL